MRQVYPFVKKKYSALVYKDNKMVICAAIKMNNLYELNIKSVISALSCNSVQYGQRTLKSGLYDFDI